MPELVGIPGIKGGRRGCEIVGSKTEIFRVLKKGLAATAAGDNGSLSVYIDDAGKFRVAFHRYCIPQDEQILGSQAATIRWVREWWPKMGDRERLALRL